MNVLIVVCSLSIFTYAAFFGKLSQLGLVCIPIKDNSPPMSLTNIRAYTSHILKWLDRHFKKGRVYSWALLVTPYIAYEKQPVSLVGYHSVITQEIKAANSISKIFFLSILSGGAALFIPATWPLISTLQKFAIAFLLPLPYIFTYFCNKNIPGSPHIISKESHAQNMSRYPYDYKLFYPEIQCKTCKFPKPARSKHCSLCHVCVARADHHCVWVNNCIGRGNYKYFLALLVSTTSLLAYTVLLAYITVLPQVRHHFELSSWQADNTQWWGDQFMVWSNAYFKAFNIALTIGGIARSGVGLLALFTVPLPAGFLGYHIYLIWAGMTTNEQMKWNDWKLELADGLGYTATIVHGNESRASYQWPKPSREILVLTTDGLPPRNLQPEIKAVVGEGVEWRRCWNLKEVDNIYDLGPWHNLLAILSE
jgi:hypothetical protein